MLVGLAQLTRATRVVAFRLVAVRRSSDETATAAAQLPKSLSISQIAHPTTCATFRGSTIGLLRGFHIVSNYLYKGKKGSPYSITERRVPELIPVLGSQPAGDVSHKPGGIGCHYFRQACSYPRNP